jgi:hypothetical protein
MRPGTLRLSSVNSECSGSSAMPCWGDARFRCQPEVRLHQRSDPPQPGALVPGLQLPAGLPRPVGHRQRGRHPAREGPEDEYPADLIAARGRPSRQLRETLPRLSCLALQHPLPAPKHRGLSRTSSPAPNRCSVPAPRSTRPGVICAASCSAWLSRAIAVATSRPSRSARLPRQPGLAGTLARTARTAGARDRCLRP